ncbi:uncharacterized protein [Rutidosis leptorrhynchoides]|uniref:uncharacterized protein n=1 Tax=Rutidosis leptorrhynchoides TaxID=125765 RepID=UPI003A9967B2
MAQRRKVDNSITDKPNIGLDFQNVANEVAKLYHQAINLQPIAFNSGRRHSLAKVHDWISSHLKDGKTLSSAEIISFVQNEINESLSTNPHLQLDVSAQISEQNHNEASENLLIGANAGSASSNSSIDYRIPGAIVPQYMDEDPSDD